jgi:hypothetical protein
MKRIGLILLALVAVGAFSGAAASSSMALCVQMKEENQGRFTDPQCAISGSGKYIQIRRVTQILGPNEECAEVVVPGTGNFLNSSCTEPGAKGEFVKIHQPAGPRWYVSGDELEGTKQLKLQLKGAAILRATVGGQTVELECKNSISEGAAIEEGGPAQGQAKGRLKFTQCRVVTPINCTMPAELTTNQTKSHLARSAETQKKYVELFEPQQGETFVKVPFTGAGCILLNPTPIKGTIAAEISPIETESQEGLLNFPEPAIKHIVLEQQERTNVGLTFGTVAGVFKAVYGARLEIGAPWGVFGA